MRVVLTVCPADVPSRRVHASSENARRRSPDPDSPTGDTHSDVVCAEVGAALNLTPGATANFFARGRAAVGALRPVNTQLLAGHWSEIHLRRAVDACAETDPEVAAVAAANVTGRLRAAPRCSPTTSTVPTTHRRSRVATLRPMAGRRTGIEMTTQAKPLSTQPTLAWPWAPAGGVEPPTTACQRCPNFVLMPCSQQSACFLPRAAQMEAIARLPSPGAGAVGVTRSLCATSLPHWASRIHPAGYPATGTYPEN